eukprot:383962-Rhodomonas_salina.1
MPTCVSRTSPSRTSHPMPSPGASSSSQSSRALALPSRAPAPASSSRFLSQGNIQLAEQHEQVRAHKPGKGCMDRACGRSSRASRASTPPDHDSLPFTTPPDTSSPRTQRRAAWSQCRGERRRRAFQCQDMQSSCSGHA